MAAFASLSALSFPIIPQCPGIHIIITSDPFSVIRWYREITSKRTGCSDDVSFNAVTTDSESVHTTHLCISLIFMYYSVCNIATASAVNTEQISGSLYFSCLSLWTNAHPTLSALFEPSVKMKSNSVCCCLYSWSAHWIWIRFIKSFFSSVSFSSLHLRSFQMGIVLAVNNIMWEHKSKILTRLG